MNTSDGFTLIESLQKIRSEDIPYALKVLQTTLEKKIIPLWFRSLEESRRNYFIHSAVGCYLQVISSAKLARGFFKILMDLPDECQLLIRKEMETCFESLIHNTSSDDVKKLCELLNVSPLAKETCKKFITSTSVMVLDKLSVFRQVSIHEAKGRQDLEVLYHVTKMCIHCLQTCNDDLLECICKLPSNELKTLWTNILHCLLSVLLQYTNQELLGLIGTAISMMLNLSASSSESSRACREILEVISTEKETASVFGTTFTKPCKSLPLIDRGLPVLMLAKGILMTSSKEILCCSDNDGRSLLSYLFPLILTPCRGPQIHHYVAFQVLTLWFQKLKAIGIKHLSMVSNNSQMTEEGGKLGGFENFMSSSCPILTSTIWTIWLNWESPVDGVSESVTAIFDCLLSIWNQALKDGISQYTELNELLIQRVLMMSWHTKTRYRPLGILLPYFDVIHLLGHYPEIKQDLVKCMNINGLAAVASDAYRAFLTQIKVQDEKNMLSVWCDLWMPTLVKGITSPDSTQRLKICTYWIPHSLKIIRGSHTVILDSLQGEMESNHGGRRIQNLLAWTTVCRYSRDIVGMALQDQHFSYIKEALVCMDDEVRAEALFLLCTTLKRATPVSKMEIEPLKTFITVNLKTDSTSFRQNMVSALKKLITRIRDSCLSEVRNQRSSSEILSNGVNFIDWFYNILLQNLFPGGTYQCRQTILDLLETTLSLLVFQEQHSTKKGKAQEGSDILMEFANRSEMWMFFQERNFFILLSCLEDGSDDIQTQCYRLLVQFFPWPNSSQWKTRHIESCTNRNANKKVENILADEKTVCSLINKALELANSPKSYETHSGLLLMSLVLKKYVENVGLIFTFQSHCKVSEVCLFNEKANATQSPSLAFLDMLMNFLETSVSTAKKDPAAQFKSHPIHGLTQYVTHCIKEVFICNSGDQSEVDADHGIYLKRLKELNEGIINLMLDILSGGGNLDQCPSFAEMGVALESLISGDDEAQEAVTTLSPDFQLLLSWCWINLKESCTSLGQVTSSALKGDRCFLSSSVISAIGDVFVRVLTTCRHRGAIEGCRSGFSVFCEVLLCSKLKEYSLIPKSMLTTVVQSLLSNSLSASISRRSAGLPIIVEVVTNQVIKVCYDKQFLKSTVDKFLSVASQPLSPDHNQQKDLSQVHAFNILKAVFCDANLASHLGPLLSKLTILVIENFDSPSWAIRNASTQLISTLVMRIFGQRNKSSGSMTLEEFYSLHPELVQYVITKLQHLSLTRNVINPSLYVLLTLLSHLVMSPSHLHDFQGRETLRVLLARYQDNPVYSLRNLSAKALVALFELDGVDAEFENLLTDFTQSRKSLNHQHGHLLCIFHLISSDVLSPSMYQKALAFFCKEEILLPPSINCLLPCTEVVLIIRKLLGNCPNDISKEMCFGLWSLMERLFAKLCRPSDEVQAGASICMREIFTTMTLIASECQDLYKAMGAFICSSLMSPNTDVREAIVSTLYDQPYQDYLNDQTVWETLWRSLATENRTPVFVQICDILYHLCDSNTSMCDTPKDLSPSFSQKLSQKWSHVESIQSSILILDAIVFNNTVPSDLLDRCATIQVWCDAILHFSKPFMNENLRLSAARALRKGGGKILAVCGLNLPCVTLENVIISLVKATIQLLEDSESNVRDEASTFVSNLMNIPHTHSSRAFQMLSQYIAQNSRCSSTMYDYLLGELYVDGDLTIECQHVFSYELQRLFEPEKESILLELHAKKIWAFSTLRALSVSRKSELSAHLTQKSHEAARDLQENLAKLVCDLQNFPFNASNKPRVMACLLGLVLIDKLCQDLPMGDHLHKLIQQLLEAPYLHPLLRSVG